MTEFNFKNTDEDYAKRTKSSLIINLVVSIIFGLIVTASSNVMWGIGIGLIMFIIQYFKADRRNNVYINKIYFDKENISIEFVDHKVINTITGHLSEFDFKKKAALQRTPTPYLAVYHNNELKIKQFEVDDWTESKMDDVINSFNKADTEA
ncbi:MAG: hypothetical protein LC117_10455 [Bacteroidia bacterium]|nr:hypothetical protein [Bacteroidia bacterium]